MMNVSTTNDLPQNMERTKIKNPYLNFIEITVNRKIAPKINKIFEPESLRIKRDIKIGTKNKLKISKGRILKKSLGIIGLVVFIFS